MADRRQSYPESATHGAETNGHDGEGENRLRAALAANGDDLADALEGTDELRDVVTTAIVVVASADDDELDALTESVSALVDTADGLTTDETATLATQLGEDADALASALDALVALEREGQIDELLDALDVVLALQRAGNLEPLVETAETLTALDVDEDAVEGANTVLAALGEAQRRSRPVGIVGFVRELTSSDVRAGVGYLLALLKAQGRRVRRR